jgi:hypothetical protein
MDRKRNYLAGTLVAVLTAAAIFEVYYFGFQLPGEEARGKRDRDDLTAKHRQDQAEIKQRIAAQSIPLQTGNEDK